MVCANKSDGGPFFPTFVKSGEMAITDGGVSLRDWFAGMALQGITANPVLSELLQKEGQKAIDAGADADSYRNEVELPLIAKTAYALAEAMILARESE